MEKQTELDVGAHKGQNHQSRPRTVVCSTSQEPQGGSFRCQPRGLRLKAEGGCGYYRRSRDARAIEVLCGTKKNAETSAPYSSWHNNRLHVRVHAETRFRPVVCESRDARQPRWEASC